MSRARHHAKKRASGGRADYYEGGSSEVAKEAAEKEQKKHGGRVKHVGKAHGGKVKHRLDKRARGGAISPKAAVHKHESHMHKGEKETKLKRGGRAGSDKAPFAPGSATHPFSSAAN